MQQLHLVGFTTDLEGLIFSARRGAKSGSFVVSLDDKLVSTIAEAHRRRNGDGDAASTDVAEKIGATPPPPRPPRPASGLNPREIQARLRGGRSIDEIAREAGVDPDWVERWARPILAEQAQVVARARGFVFEKARRGPSAEPLGRSVAWNVADKGVYLSPSQFNNSWSAYQSVDRWVVRFRYQSRGREHEAAWELDGDELIALDRGASELGYLDRARRRRARPRVEIADRDEPAGIATEEPAPPAPEAPSPPPRRVAKRRVAKRRAAPRRPAAKKRSPVKKAAAVKKARKAPPRKRAATAVAKKPAPVKKTATKRVAKKVVPKRAAARKSAPRRSSTRKAAPKGASAKRSRPRAAARPAAAAAEAPVRRARAAATIPRRSASARREEMLASAGEELAPRADFARSGNPEPPPEPAPRPRARKRRPLPESAKSAPAKRPAAKRLADRSGARPRRAPRPETEAREVWGPDAGADGPETAAIPEIVPATPEPARRRPRRPLLRSRRNATPPPPPEPEVAAPEALGSLAAPPRSRRRPQIDAQTAGDIAAAAGAEDDTDGEPAVRLVRRRRPLRAR